MKGYFEYGTHFQLTDEPDGPVIYMKAGGNITDNEQTVSGHLTTTTTMTRTATSFTEDTAFWTGIRNSTEALSFNNYLSFMDWIFCGGKLPPPGFETDRYDVKQSKYYNDLKNKRFLPFTDSDAYRVVKAATEAFVMVNCGIHQQFSPFDPNTNRPNRDDAYLDRRDLPIPDEELSTAFDKYLVPVNGDKTLPYLAVIRRKLPDIPIKTTLFEDAVPRTRGDENKILDNCFGLLQDKLTNPCLLELIWSYWHEEGMLVQTMNAITRRFPERTYALRPGPTCQSGDGSAAPAQQPVLGLYSG